MVAMELDAEPGDRLPGSGDALDHAPGPAFFDADDNRGGYVRIRAGADQRPKVQIEVRPELQAPIGVGYGQAAFDVMGDGFRGRVRKIVHRQNDNMIAHAGPPVFSRITPESRAIEI